MKRCFVLSRKYNVILHDSARVGWGTKTTCNSTSVHATPLCKLKVKIRRELSSVGRGAHTVCSLDWSSLPSSVFQRDGKQMSKSDAIMYVSAPTHVFGYQSNVNNSTCTFLDKMHGCIKINFTKYLVATVILLIYYHLKF